MAKVPDVIWLASYPKSGNTWLRFLLANLLFGRVAATGDLGKMIPDLHCGFDLGDFLGRDWMLVKTHSLFGPGLALNERTRKVIYIVRNPLDVLVSNLNYSRLLRYDEAAGADEALAHKYADAFIAARGDPAWREIGYGSWVENVEIWLGGGHGCPVLTVRYEDLLTDTRAEMDRICAFLDLRRDPVRIDAAIRDSSFDSMRRLEDAEKREKKSGIFYDPTREAAYQAGFRFMNKGKRGDGRRSLTPLQLGRAMDAFGPTLEKYDLGQNVVEPR
jgi:hypothetical protein